jgi:hypothetical protein
MVVPTPAGRVPGAVRPGAASRDRGGSPPRRVRVSSPDPDADLPDELAGAEQGPAERHAAPVHEHGEPEAAHQARPGDPAREQPLLGRRPDRCRVGQPVTAVLEGGRRRVRPNLMTGLAMMMGMLPTALALAEGGDQSAPLGRAVVGGLLGSLVGTLVFLPAVLAWLRGRGTTPLDLSPEGPEDEPTPAEIAALEHT